MIGLSLSFCIRDIVEGKVSIDEVEKIIAGTRCYTNEEFERLLVAYKKIYWHDYPWAVEIARKFWKEGKIEQPRCNGKDSPDICYRHWIK